MKKWVRCIIILVVSVAIMASCNNTDDKDGFSENEPIAAVIKSELAERGIKLGMTEEEVKNIESDINFVLEPNLSFVGTEHTQKTIYSETPIKYAGHDAIISYTFQDDCLSMVSYDIEVNYTSSELTSSPAYALFLDLTLKYTEALGNPQSAEIDNDSSFWTRYDNMWYNGDINKTNYVIGIHTNQSKYSSYAEDYSDSVLLSFAGEPY